ncbi:MAG: biotin/lipoyl-containing protein [Candidatus Thorarchaeota archaeon]
MSHKYSLRLDDKVFTAELERLDDGGLLMVKISGQTYAFKPEVQNDGTLMLNDTVSSHTVKILARSGNRVTVDLDGRRLEVVLERTRAEHTLGVTTGVQTPGKRVKGGVYPPMPGKITDVLVRVGDTVKSGQAVCILEAMKMFNELKAPIDGVVRQVNVKLGSTVKLDDLLVLIE